MQNNPFLHEDKHQSDARRYIQVFSDQKENV